MCTLHDDCPVSCYENRQRDDNVFRLPPYGHSKTREIQRKISTVRHDIYYVRSNSKVGTGERDHRLATKLPSGASARRTWTLKHGNVRQGKYTAPDSSLLYITQSAYADACLGTVRWTLTSSRPEIQA